MILNELVRARARLERLGACNHAAMEDAAIYSATINAALSH